MQSFAAILAELLCTFGIGFAPLRENKERKNTFHAKTQRRSKAQKRTLHQGITFQLDHRLGERQDQALCFLVHEFRPEFAVKSRPRFSFWWRLASWFLSSQPVRPRERRRSLMK